MGISGFIYIFIVIIAIIFIIYLKKSHDKNDSNKKEHDKSHMFEEERVKEISGSKSAGLPVGIISRVVKLKKSKKQLFCEVYNLPSNQNEDVLKFIRENWISSDDIHKDEMTSLCSTLDLIKGRYRKEDIFLSLKNSMPKSLIHKVLVKDNYICQKCGKNLLSSETEDELHSEEYIDLIKPLSEGGTLTEDNLITVCKRSCEHHFVPSRELFEIYENSEWNHELNVSNYEKGRLSFNYPDYYLIANIPENCPDCIVALAKNDGKCDILIEMSNNLNNINNINLFNVNFIGYVMDLDGFHDIKTISIEKINEKEWRFVNRNYEKQTCFIAIADAPSTNDGLVKSIIYFDFRSYEKSFKITLNSLLEDHYDCMGDLYVIANSLEYME